MSEAGFTPGPWHLSTYYRARVCGKRTDGEGTYVADCDCNGLDSANTENLANANLIAAAPDLLEALQDIVDTGFAGGPQGKRAHAAIAKALGR